MLGTGLVEFEVEAALVKYELIECESDVVRGEKGGLGGYCNSSSDSSPSSLMVTRVVRADDLCIEYQCIVRIGNMTYGLAYWVLPNE